jgi:hypothetical protein
MNGIDFDRRVALMDGENAGKSTKKNMGIYGEKDDGERGRSAGIHADIYLPFFKEVDQGHVKTPEHLLNFRAFLRGYVFSRFIRKSYGLKDGK